MSRCVVCNGDFSFCVCLPAIVKAAEAAFASVLVLLKNYFAVLSKLCNFVCMLCVLLQWWCQSWF